MRDSFPIRRLNVASKMKRNEDGEGSVLRGQFSRAGALRLCGCAAVLLLSEATMKAAAGALLWYCVPKTENALIIVAEIETKRLHIVLTTYRVLTLALYIHPLLSCDALTVVRCSHSGYGAAMGGGTKRLPLHVPRDLSSQGRPMERGYRNDG